MSNWSNLKNAVSSIIKSNGAQGITGQLLQDVLKDIISIVGFNSSFAGIATPKTNPGTPDGNVFYIASKAGTYSNFNGIVVLPGEAVILEWKGSWTKNIPGFATQEKLSELVSNVGISNLEGKANVYKNATAEIWSTPNKYVVLELNTINIGNKDTSDSLSMIKVSCYSFEQKKIDDINIALYIDASGNIRDIFAYFNSKINLYHDGRNIMLSIGDSLHRVLATEVVTTNKFHNLQISKILFFYDKPIGNWAEIENKEILNDESTEYYKPVDCQSGYIDTTGEKSNYDTNWISTDFIPLSAYKNGLLNLKNNNSLTYAVAYYDADKNFLKDISIIGGNVDYIEKKIDFSSEAEYVRLCGCSASFGQYSPRLLMIIDNKINLKEEKMLEYRKKSVKLSLLPSAKLLLYGTSRSSTDYSWFKEQMIAYTGLENVYNGGFSGYSSSMLASDECLSRIWDYEPDVILLEFGGNEVGDIVGTFGSIPNQPLVAPCDIERPYSGTYFIQAVDYVVRRVKKQYYDLRARAEISGSESASELIDKIKNVKKVYIAVTTDMPQKRQGGDNSWNLESNWENKRNAVVECCNKNNVHCIDLYNLSGIDMSKEPEWYSPTDMVNQRGIYTMDGLHLSEAGYEIITQIICGEINIIINPHN